ncbi:MAG TPA: exonuclease [Lachnospiraceae bacterium]|nr:exonuclease [Lachnospiraceae bacterium]HCA70784.1 exonuclease [Lachnospiraceae bacterium]HCM13425.1 exonuclease [Lachnospiraceae bacterium]HCR40695.1 exonuclease [Lachnospiraceae bacterium]
MITRQLPMDLDLQYPFTYDRTKILFFDIETTGFSPETTYLYLIGCIYYKDSSFQLIQWFSEGIDEEACVIQAFFEFSKNYEALIHFNGSGFDIPYLLRKCFLLKLPYAFDYLQGIDLYKKIYPYRKILRLPNCKQKTIEAFLHISRKDTLDGGDLIEVYQAFLGKRRYEILKRKHRHLTSDERLPANPSSSNAMPSESETLLQQILLHNEDDIKGLVQICPILYYADLFEKPIRIQKANIKGTALIIEFELVTALPVPIQYSTDIVCFTAQETQAALSIELFEGELKYFYENYKDYYYLPAEDRAIHKSLAAFVDKDYRQKAKPATCYTRKKGIFVPQYEPVITPYFQQKYSDKISFLEIHTDFLLQEENLERYVHHILSHMMKG